MKIETRRHEADKLIDLRKVNTGTRREGREIDPFRMRVAKGELAHCPQKGRGVARSKNRHDLGDSRNLIGQEVADMKRQI